MTKNGNEGSDALQRWTEGAEQALSANFASWVGELDLERLVSEPDTRLDRYALTPITVRSAEAVPSTWWVGKYFALQPGVILEETPHADTFLETAYAIGLTYENRLQGLAAASLALGTLIIKQIQGTTGPRSSGQFYGRFAWQDPLVKGWLDIGQKLGASQISIQGSKNNRWIMDVGFARLQNELRKEGKPVPARKSDLTQEQTIESLGKGVEALAKNYDDVAGRLGFDKHPDHNWYLPLPSNA